MDSFEWLIIHPDKGNCMLQGFFIHSSNGQDRVADKPDNIVIEKDFFFLFFRSKKKPVLNDFRNFKDRGHGFDAGQLKGRSGIDAKHSGMGVGTADEPGMEHVIKPQIRSESGPARDLVHAVDALKGFPDMGQGFSHGIFPSFLWRL